MKYHVRKVKKGQWDVIDVTEHGEIVVETFSEKAKATAIAISLRKGCGFKGNTPPFFGKNVISGDNYVQP